MQIKYQLRAYSKARREAARARGLCQICCKAQALEGYTTCRECMIRNSVNDEKRKKERAAAGLCPECGKERKDKRYKRCEACRERGRRYAKEKSKHE